MHLITLSKIEAYGIGGKPYSRLGVWRSFAKECDEGLTKMLLENQIDFDVATSVKIFLSTKFSFFQVEVNYQKRNIKS